MSRRYISPETTRAGVFRGFNKSRGMQIAIDGGGIEQRKDRGSSLRRGREGSEPGFGSPWQVVQLISDVLCPWLPEASSSTAISAIAEARRTTSEAATRSPTGGSWSSHQAARPRSVDDGPRRATNDAQHGGVPCQRRDRSVCPPSVTNWPERRRGSGRAGLTKVVPPWVVCESVVSEAEGPQRRRV